MIQTLPMRPAARNTAGSVADSNYAANLAALATLQPDVAAALSGGSVEAEWIFARDGSLTAMLPGEQWWGGCSLPRRAGQFMFRTMEIHGVLGCFLAPVHAAHIRIAMDLLEPHQAVLALVPDSRTVQIILHCEDFAADIRAHRLWLAPGDDWQAILAGMFVENPGLPTPAEFIRAISADNTAADQLIAPAQKIFAGETARRSAEIQNFAKQPDAGIRPGAVRVQAGQAASRMFVGKLCVIAPSQFRLWNDAPAVLAGIVSGGGTAPPRLFDSDDPASASPLGLAMALRDCNALVAANLGRADLPRVVPDDMPIMTWITHPRIPPHDPGDTRDALVLADPAWQTRASAAGWPAERIEIGGWPHAGAVMGPAAGFVALIADTHQLVPPKQVSDFSSHLLLWELIESELSGEPELVGTDLDGYLKSRMKRFQIGEESLNKAFFIERLIVPAYQQGLASALIAQGIPIRLFGKGWDVIQSFASHAGGPVNSRERFEEIVAVAGALVHAWPIGHAHPIDAAGRAVIRPDSGGAAAPVHRVPPLSRDTIFGLLMRTYAGQ